jgi:hypothetical protein
MFKVLWHDACKTKSGGESVDREYLLMPSVINKSDPVCSHY